MRGQLVMTAIVLTLSGCAGYPPSKPTPVPPDRIYYVQPAMVGNLAKVVFTRGKRKHGSGGLYQHIYLNGKRIASIMPGERLELNIPAGEWVFGVKPTDLAGQYKLNTIKESLEGGKDYLYRIVAERNKKETKIERTDPSAELSYEDD